MRATLSPLVSNLIALALGSIAAWAPSGLDSWQKTRSQRRAALGHIISTLLEIRNRLRLRQGLSAVIHAIEDGLIQEQAFEVLKRIENLLPTIGELAVNYRKAIRLLASEDPILAFRMRHLDSTIDRMQAIPDELGDFVRTVEDQVVVNDMMAGTHSKVVEVLGEAIIEIAYQHGMATWFKVKRLFRTEHGIFEILDEMSESFAEPTRTKFRAEFDQIKARMNGK